MMRYGKSYGGTDPEMIEGDIFRIIVNIPEFVGKIDVPVKAHDKALEPMSDIYAPLY